MLWLCFESFLSWLITECCYLELCFQIFWFMKNGISDNCCHLTFIHTVKQSCNIRFLLLGLQSMQQSVSNHNQGHFNNSTQKAMRIHNMFPRFLILNGVLLWIVWSVGSGECSVAIMSVVTYHISKLSDLCRTSWKQVYASDKLFWVFESAPS